MSALTDWIGASAAAVAAVGTVGSLWATVTVLRRQTDSARRHQASRVNAVVRVNVNQQPHWPPVIDVHNNSDHAVYDLIGFAVGRDGKRFQVSEQQPRQLLAEGTTHLVLTNAAYFDETERPYLRYEVGFTDEAGLRWMRTANGPLREVPIAKQRRRDRLRVWQHNRRRRLPESP